LPAQGDQGMQKRPLHGRWPQKKPSGGKRSAKDKAYKRQLARDRVGVEQVKRRLKVFRILSGRDQHRRKRFGRRCHLLAA
ncbi:MAG: IS5/IS1182 family transposase, partial [Stenomitos rutilans HA7619-LM2]|nr:IS5/IS1182 family transposase [Stenomitos rutilans HA7619-LM2]